MKIRTRLYRKADEKEGFWPSFVDVMTTVTLVFFFIMIIGFAVLLGKAIDMKGDLNNIIEERHKLYTRVEQELKPVLGDNVEYVKGEELKISSEVLFDLNQSQLNEQGKEIAHLMAVAFNKILEDETNKEKIESIEIVGHTCSRGVGTDNRTLSTERAVSFLNQMIQDNKSYNDPNDFLKLDDVKGRDQEYEDQKRLIYSQYIKLFKASGMSEYKPLNDNETEEERALNRRIEVKINFNNDDINKLIEKYFFIGN